MKAKKKWIIPVVIVVVIVIVVAAVLPVFASSRGTELPTSITKTAIAELGDIEKTVTGSGSLAYTDSVSVEMPSDLELKSIDVEVGDTVKTGDMLAQIDSISLNTAIDSVKTQIESTDALINDAKSDTEQKTITSSVGGRVKAIYAKEGEDVTAVVANNGSLMLLSVDGKLKVNIQGANNANISLGDDVDVLLSDGKKKEGKVAQVSTEGVTVTISDNGTTLGDSVSVIAKNGQKIGGGVLEINTPVEVLYSKGRVKSVNVAENDKITTSTKLITLEETVAEEQYEVLLATRDQYVQTLRTLLEYAKTNTIVATTDGVVKEINVSTQGTSSTQSTDSSQSQNVGVTYGGMGGDSFMLLYNKEGDVSELSTEDSFTTKEEYPTPTQSAEPSPSPTITPNEQISGLIEVFINNPVSGNTPQSTIMPGQGYTGTISWMPNTPQFAGAQVYTANVALTAQKGYTFGSDATPNVAGGQISAVTLNETNSRLTFSVTFPQTAEAVKTDNQQLQQLLQQQQQQQVQQSGTPSSSAMGGYSGGGASASTSQTAQSAGTSSDGASSSSYTKKAFVISTNSAISLTANIDELDILTVMEGQEVKIELDALPEEVFEGVVTKIANSGTSGSGVTTYPASIALTQKEGISLKEGMNASATIVTGKSENTLIIPLSALTEQDGKQYVTIFSSNGDDGNNKGASEQANRAMGELREVTTGLSNAQEVEILSGLSEGEEIIYTESISTDSSGGMMQMFGGMPGGAMPPANMGGRARQ